MRYPYLIVFLCIIFSRAVVADLTTEFKGFAPNNVLGLLLQQVSGEYERKALKLDIDGNELFEGLKIKSSELDINLKLDARMESGARVGIFFSVTEALFTAGKVHLLSEIFERIPGLRVRIITEARCETAKIKIKNLGGFMRSSLDFSDGQIKVSLLESQYILGEGQEEISFDLSSCQGPEGLEGLLEEELTKWLYSEDGQQDLLSIFIDEIQGEVESQLANLSNEGFEVNFLDDTVKLRITEGTFFEEGLEFEGILRLPLSGTDISSKFEEETFTLNDPNAGMIRFPTSFFDDVLEAFILTSKSLKFVLNRSEIPGVDKLFSSRLIQFFVWSDLSNFPKNSNFDVGVQLLPESLQLLERSSTKMDFHLYSRHLVDMDFKNSREEVFPYMNFFGNLSSNLSVSFGEEGLQAQIFNLEINADCVFDEDMMSWRKTRPGGKPWMSVILDQAKGGLEGQTFNWTWDQLGLEGFKSIKPIFTPHDFRLVFELENNKPPL